MKLKVLKKIIQERKEKIKDEQKRLNVFITSIENHFKEENPVLVSKTDLTGKIIYANRAFEEISEYERGELIGKPHSIVRHPDMPRSAFYDLWQTLQMGLPWRGYVKNRSKNGNYYWVDANVAPIKKNGKNIGYISVRRRADNEEKQRHEDLYREIREGKKEFEPTIFRQTSPINRIKSYVIFFTFFNLIFFLLQYFLNFPFFISIIIVIVLSVLIVSLAFRSLDHMKARIQELIDKTNEMVEKNLSINFNTRRNDELGFLEKALLNLLINAGGMIGELQDTLSRLQEVYNELKQSTNSLASFSDEYIQKVRFMANQIKEIDKLLQNISASMEEFSISTKEVSKKNSESYEITKKTAESLQKANHTIFNLVEHIKTILSFTDSINSIAEQTNLLALNAAIEAASAGEHGKGFTVVANEIKNLAYETKNHTIKLKELSQVIRKELESTIQSMATLKEDFLTLENVNSVIVSAVEEQTISIRENAKYINNVSDSLQKVSQSLDSFLEESAQLTKAVQTNHQQVSEIEKEIQHIHSIIKEYHI
ncbi:MAG: methyl-accepting chemotaxis protein [Leptospiraceae bacterium]|nr:methyl-accepting chemotaxis protein [Leptospiraceae bacterium]MDW7976887.1 PAS domain-containing methyl-accepting chemotaxis protein [Leptospiraceae bacterium]